VKIAVDVMGGDDSPFVVIDGVRLFLEENPEIEFVLVGQERVIKQELEKFQLLNNPRISVKNATQVIEMGESPIKALRQKKSSSISIMMDLAKSNLVDAVLSAGNTGAMVSAATLKLRTLPNIDRPGIATVMPTPYGRNILMDVGAVTDCKSKNLVQFAIMGESIAQLIMDIQNPSIGLLNVGEEESKGSELTKEVFSILKASNLNFYGNVEGSDVFTNTVNVIITDGFTGNTILKASESLAKGIFSVLKREVKKSFLSMAGAFLMKKAFKGTHKQFNHEEYGGALLLGVNGVVIISHGSSTAIAIKNAIKTAVKMVSKNVNSEIIKRMERLNNG